MRLLVRVNIFGTLEGLEPLARSSAILAGKLDQAGLARHPPEKNSWHYSSSWLTLGIEDIDLELQGFLASQDRLKEYQLTHGSGISFALLTLCPVKEEDDDASFACLLDVETVRAICALGLSLEIAPAPWMPTAPDWRAFNAGKVDSS